MVDGRIVTARAREGHKERTRRVLLFDGRPGWRSPVRVAELLSDESRVALAAAMVAVGGRA